MWLEAMTLFTPAPWLLMAGVSNSGKGIDRDSPVSRTAATGRGPRLQGTGEESTFSDSQLTDLLALGKAGIKELLAAQIKAINQV